MGKLHQNNAQRKGNVRNGKNLVVWWYFPPVEFCSKHPNTEDAVRNNMSDQECWVNMLQEVNFHSRQKKKITRMTISILIQY